MTETRKGSRVTTAVRAPRLRRGALPTVRIFSSAPDAQRARRPTDAVLFVAAVVGIGMLSIPAPGPTALDTAAANLVTQLPGLFGWFWEIAYDLLIGWSLLLLTLALFARGRKRLFLDMLLAIAVALGAAILGGLAAGTEPGTTLEALFRSSSPPVYVATRLALATAVVATASPHMARPLRYTGRWLVLLGAVATIALGAAMPIGVFAGFLVGFAAAALTHLLVGSPGGRLTIEQIADALAQLGVDIETLEETRAQPVGESLASGITTDGRSLLVKTFGRDAWDEQLVTSVWTALWYRGDGRHLGVGRLQQVEHEAFVTLLAERGGVPVMPVVTAGSASDGDALLALEMRGATLASFEGVIDGATLRSAWTILDRLHGLGVAHRRINASRIAMLDDGSVAFLDLSDAAVSGTDSERLTDRAQLLVTTALLAGFDPAVDGALGALGSEGLAETLPYLQPAVLDGDTRRAIKGQDWNLKALRELVADRTQSEVPPLEPIRRVTWRTLAKFAVAGFLAYALVSAFANVGIDTLIQEFQEADVTWLVAALLLAPLSQIPQAFSTMGATLLPLRFSPSLMLQYGVQFIALAVPSSAARVALEVRFFQRFGASGAAALSIGALDSFSTFLIQIVMILVITLSGMASLDLSDTGASRGSSGSVNWQAIVVGGVLIVVALAIGLAVPKTRAVLRRSFELLREKASDAKAALQVLRHPAKLLMLLGGNLVAQVMLAVILGLCLRAFGHSASLAALILVNTFVSLFAGFMPVPGGVGVAEAGFTAGLMAIGVPDAAATSTAIAFRLVTFYLPPLWGAGAMRWLRRHDYL